MEGRIHELEKSVGEIRECLVKIEPRLEHTATIASVEAARIDLIRWFLGTAVLLAGLSFSMARFVH